jgi:predicted transcriptional regulator
MRLKLPGLDRGTVGILRLIQADGGQDQEPPAKAIACSGVFGTEARRCLRISGMAVEFEFNALEECISAVLQGKNCTLYVDARSREIVASRLGSLESRFGLRLSTQDS